MTACTNWRPGHCWASLPVYYKTFAQFRGEPYLAFFVVLLVYRTLLVFQSQTNYWMHTLPGLVLAIGGVALSRQWGFFAFPAVAIAVVILWLRATVAG